MRRFSALRVNITIFLAAAFAISLITLCIALSSTRHFTRAHRPSGPITGCTDPRLTLLLPPEASITATLDAYNGSEPWPPAFRCEPLEIFGGALTTRDGRTELDGDKRVCGLRELQAPCSVYSLGSKLDFSFEAAVASATRCDIVTADCTVRESAARVLLPPRTRFFPVCIGSELLGKRYISLSALQTKAGHPRIDVLKMDIEGFETLVIKDLLALHPAEMPFQILVETHGGRAAAWVSRALVSLGYVPVSKQQNTLWRLGWEWTWVRASCGVSESSTHVNLSVLHKGQRVLEPFDGMEPIERGFEN
jgi:hypothetical protein